MDGNFHEKNNDKGQSLTEFAIGLVVLIIVLVGTVDTGRALVTYLALRDAAQEGAIYASLAPTDFNGIESRVWGSSTLLTDLQNDANADMSVQITYMGSQICTGYPIEVSVLYENFPVTIPFLGTIIGSQTVPIKGSIKETILQPPCQ